MKNVKNGRSVPNQRKINVYKTATDKTHKYTTNNLEALAEASKNLNTLGGFKLYMYLAKNQDNYHFALSSADFCEWSGLGLRAYNTAFKELENNGYLIAQNESKTIYNFRDKLDIELSNVVYFDDFEAPTEEFFVTEDRGFVF